MNTLTISELETAIAAHARAFPSMAFTRKALGELMRVTDQAVLDKVLDNLCLRGVLQQQRIRMVLHWQARPNYAEIIARQTKAKPLAREYTDAMYRHWRQAEAMGGRA